jgi:hypothetical protein
MTLFWLVWLGLVLGGLVASLWYQQKTGRVTWFRLARARALRKDRLVWQHSVPLTPTPLPPLGKREWSGSLFREMGQGGGIMPPPPTVVTRTGPPRHSTS